MDFNFLHEEKKYDFSIIIPAYNEGQRIYKTLNKINKYINEKDLNAEIIIVNDGSSDNTVEILNNIAAESKNLKIIDLIKNQGKGFVVKNGVLAAKGKYILFTDADNSTPIEELEKLIPHLNENEIIIGSRYLDKESVQKKQAKYRIVISRLGNLLIQSLVIKGIKDTQCGFKLFHSNVAKQIFTLQKIKRFGFDIEILSIGQKYNFNIKEVPVLWINDAASHVRPVRDSLITFKDLMLIKLNLLSGRYDID